MLRLTEVASQSETFSKRGLRKAKTNTVNSIIDWMAQPGHCPVVFSLDRPPLLVDRLRPGETKYPPIKTIAFIILEILKTIRDSSSETGDGSSFIGIDRSRLR